MNIQNLIRKPVQMLPEIAWGQTSFDDSYLNLKWGENPYAPSATIQKAIKDSLVSTNRYPDLMNTLIEKLSQYTGVSTNQLCITNGSDKAFRIIAELFIERGNQVITFTPSYPVFDGAIEMMGGKIIKIPLEKNFVIPKIKKIKKFVNKKAGLIYVCNPNNPTGNFIATNGQIEALLKLNLIVIVDEAYFEFSGKTCCKLLNKYDNLIILRSFSKTFGLAGLRVGYILSSAKIVKYANRIEKSLEIFNCSTPSLAGAITALNNPGGTNKNIRKINLSREIFSKKLNELSVIPYPSETSFIMFDLKKTGIAADTFIQRMKMQKVILKDVSIYSGLTAYDCYMAIPENTKVNQVLRAVKKALSPQTR